MFSHPFICAATVVLVAAVITIIAFDIWYQANRALNSHYGPMPSVTDDRQLHMVYAKLVGGTVALLVLLWSLAI